MTSNRVKTQPIYFDLLEVILQLVTNSLRIEICGVEQRSARLSHKQKVPGSNPGARYQISY